MSDDGKVIWGKFLIGGQFRERYVRIKDGIIVEALRSHTGPVDHRFPRGVMLPAATDIHVHMRDPDPNPAEDFLHGTRAAALGGVTTVFDMPNNTPPIIDAATMTSKIRNHLLNAHVDFGIYAGITAGPERKDGQKQVPEELLGLSPLSKAYLGSTTGSLLIGPGDVVAFLDAVPAGSLAPFVSVHSEDQRCLSESGAGGDAPGDLEAHDRARPLKCEISGVRRLFDTLARSTLQMKYRGPPPQSSPPALPTFNIAHVTAEEVIFETHRAARLLNESWGAYGSENIGLHMKEGPAPEGNHLDPAPGRISIEASPHHLLLNTEYEGELLGKVNPPLRSRRDQTNLLRALADGRIGVVASDHAPHPRDSKAGGGEGVPSGLPGVQTLYPLLLNQAASRRVHLTTVVQVCSSNPAALMGLNKGHIAPGFRADMVGVELDAPRRISDDMMASKCRWTPYTGFEGVFPHTVLLAGDHVVDDGQFCGRPGTGRFLGSPTHGGPG